ncbi:lytic transglycosylase domain-containing protein [Burkholderia cenocepacia]|uniref:lytic transglycosylase domain-containing protein n=1 Tax=Burkholderia cenocepacia TaxID=95486 RepID=UPI002AB7C318|nr:lytic transglycosylase domain-containing protein [Burkholderia cenocepacia]
MRGISGNQARASVAVAGGTMIVFAMFGWASDALAGASISAPTSAPFGEGGFSAMAQACAPGVHPQLMGRIGRIESSGNPYAIGVVGGHLVRQPTNRAEALATVKALDSGGWNYSLGIVQVNVHNFERYGVSAADMFDPCRNLKTGAAILTECYTRARAADPRNEQRAVHAALSCYYSGDLKAGRAYALKVAAAAPIDSVRVPDAIGIVSDGVAPRASSRGARSAGRALAERRELGAADDWFDGGDDEPRSLPNVRRRQVTAVDQGGRPANASAADTSSGGTVRVRKLDDSAAGAVRERDDD